MRFQILNLHFVLKLQKQPRRRREAHLRLRLEVGLPQRSHEYGAGPGLEGAGVSVGSSASWCLFGCVSKYVA